MSGSQVSERAQASVELGERGLNALYGPGDRNLRRFERELNVGINARGGRVEIEGEAERVEKAADFFANVQALLATGFEFREEDITTAISAHLRDPDQRLEEIFLGNGLVQSARALVRPRTINQHRYLQAMAESDLVVSIGPAGTGKTYLAVAMAAALLKEKSIRRIVLARPAVEAGEKLGFLPGDLVEKVNPYLRPLYDALYDIIGFDRVTQMIDRGVIEVAPIAFMRGRTLNDSFVILDEAQNTTPEQMKMFLTRIGFGSRAVVNGDVTQVDLPESQRSGLRDAEQVLAGVRGVEFLYFEPKDVVRHRLVQRIINAYDKRENSDS